MFNKSSTQQNILGANILDNTNSENANKISGEGSHFKYEVFSNNVPIKERESDEESYKNTSNYEPSEKSVTQKNENYYKQENESNRYLNNHLNTLI